VLAATRAARNQSTANLLPAEFATRYRQQLVDRLWMRGLGAVVVLYLLGIAAYFVGVQIETYRRDRLRQEVTLLASSFTNALTLKERVRVFQEQAGLKYAALECWRIASELLPPEVTLETINFQGGDRLFLSGTVASDNQEKVTQFRSDLRKARVEGTPVFDEDQVGSPQFTPRGPNLHRWDFTANFKARWLE
jgi:Tfp pilus assembly protein PilN